MAVRGMALWGEKSELTKTEEQEKRLQSLLNSHMYVEPSQENGDPKKGAEQEAFMRGRHKNDKFARRTDKTEGVSCGQ